MIHHLPTRSRSQKDISKLVGMVASTRGRILPPLLLYLLGVPGVIVILLWVFVFRG